MESTSSNKSRNLSHLAPTSTVGLLKKTRLFSICDARQWRHFKKYIQTSVRCAKWTHSSFAAQATSRLEMGWWRHPAALWRTGTKCLSDRLLSRQHADLCKTYKLFITDSADWRRCKHSGIRLCARFAKSCDMRSIKLMMFCTSKWTFSGILNWTNSKMNGLISLENIIW